MSLKACIFFAQEGPSDEAFAMVQCRGLQTPYTIFVTSMFRICAGDYDVGMETFIGMWEVVDSWEEAVFIAQMVISQIITMGTPRSGLYFKSHVYPFEDVPTYVFVGCSSDEVCQACFPFWFSLLIRSFC